MPEFIDPRDALARTHAKIVAMDRIRKAQTITDNEAAHREADGALCDYLIQLGHDDLVIEWRKVRKWYA